MYNLGLLYVKDEGVKPDYAKALNLFKKSSDLGCHDSFYVIAQMYQEVRGIKKAKEWKLKYEKEWKLKYADAFNDLWAITYLYAFNRSITIN